ncbi:retrotransposon protein, putative, ty1-copia subclass [Tanacetum coccineum]
MLSQPAVRCDPRIYHQLDPSCVFGGSVRGDGTTFGLRRSKKLKHGALSLYMGNGVRATIKVIGSFDLILPSGLIIVLDNCHFAPTVTRGVVSISRLLENDYSHTFTNYGISVSKDNVFYFNAIPHDGIYEIDMHNIYPNVTSTFNVSNKRVKYSLDSYYLWHCRLGHINKKRMDKLQRDGILQMQGASYFITFTDDFSGYGYVYLMKHKHEVFETFKVFQNEVENQLGKKIKAIRSDQGGEYLSHEFVNHMKSYGIVSQITPPYTLQHNGVSERRNRTLLDMVRSMMNLTTLPKSFWGYALESVACILNMVPTKKVERTPYEIWHRKAPKLSYLRVWGCYPKETMGYYFYYRPENKIFVAQNVEFFENSLIVQEASGSHGPLKMSGSDERLELIQEEDTQPSENTSGEHNEVVPIEERELGNLNEPPNYKAALSNPEYDKWLEASGSSVSFLILYVDDILLMGNNVTMLQEVKSWLSKCFSMTDLGEAAYILGIKIIRDRSKWLISLSQSTYLEKILKKFRKENSKKGYTPIMEKPDYRKFQGAKTPSEVQHMERVPYASAIGSFMYATAVKTILKYVRNTKDMVLVYGAKPKAELKVSCYADAKAEYIAAAEASMEAVWMRKFSDGLGDVVPLNKRPMEMLYDNEQAIAIATDPDILKEARHFQKKYDYIHKVIQEREIFLKKVHTYDNVADPFTKPMSFNKHFEHAMVIGIVPASSLM